MISIVSPVYNEEKVIREFCSAVAGVLDGADIDYEIVLVDDGSSDASFSIMRECQAASAKPLRIVRLARNFGHQIAITAGLKAASGEAVVVMDCDLQDPPAMIPDFVRHWKEGDEIVYGVRKLRKGESFFKKFTADLFYRLIRMASKMDIPRDAGDFYLLDRRVVDELNKMEERHRFIRGMIVWLGFRRRGVEYVREPRLAGKTKFGLWNMVKFSFDAATSFTFLPLRMIAFMGLVVFFFSFLGILIIFYQKLFTDTTITGWASMMVVVLFLGGIQLLSIGVIGEYIARIGDDVKRRPLYTVSEIIEPSS